MNDIDCWVHVPKQVIILAFEKPNLLTVALLFFSRDYFKVIVSNKMDFQGNGCIFNLETKQSVIGRFTFLFESWFWCFWHTKNGCIFNYCAGIWSTHVIVMSVSNANTITCVYPLAPISYEMEECYIHNVLIT